MLGTMNAATTWLGELELKWGEESVGKGVNSGTTWHAEAERG